MFPRSYFAAGYFAPVYFPPVVSSIPIPTPARDAWAWGSGPEAWPEMARRLDENDAITIHLLTTLLMVLED
jgi:hypothetical protein